MHPLSFNNPPPPPHPVPPPQENLIDPNFTYARLVDQLNFSNMTLANISHQLNDMRLEMNVLRTENDKLNSVINDMRAHTPQGSSTPHRGGEVNDADAAEKARLTVSEVESAFNEFCGTDYYPIRKWIADFEEMADSLGLSELRKYVVAKRKLIGIARSSLNTVRHVTSWAALKGFLIGEFDRHENSATVHEKVRNRRKSAVESVFEYYLVMTELGAKANLDAEAIITHVVNGINDSGADKTVLYGAKTIDEFKEQLRVYQNIKDSKQSSGSGQMSERYQQTVSPRKQSSVQYRSNGNTLGSRMPVCFGCQEPGHIMRNCPRKLKKSVKLCSSTAVVEKGTFLTVIIDSVPKEVLFDCGAGVSLIRNDLQEKLGLAVNENEKQDLHTLSGRIRTLGVTSLETQIEDRVMMLSFSVLPVKDLKMEMLLGRNLLVNGDVTVSTSGSRFIPKVVNFVYSIGVMDEPLEDPVNHICNANIRDAVRTLIAGYKPRKPNKTEVKLKIFLKDEISIQQLPRRLAPLEKEIVQKEISKWLEEGVIQPSSSEFSSPIVLSHKKDGTRRLCVDYRRLNKVIIRDHFPLPLIEDVIDELQGARIFTTLDLENGFFHVPVDEDSRKYTAFVTPSGQYEFLATSFGLSTSPTVFQRYINNIFRGLIEKQVVIVYIDDLLIPTKNEKEALEKLKMVLEVAERHGLRIKWQNCQFLKRKIEYLGYEIEEAEIRPTKDKIAAVKNFPDPKNFKEIQRFLGLTGFFRKFVENYSVKAKPLTDLLKKDADFVFGQEQKAAVEQLKQALCSRSTLTLYHPQATTELHTDANKAGYGEILLQKRPDDEKFHPIYYFSRKTSSAEENYPSYELEVLAVVAALKKFRVYLLGIPFKIITDCSAFKMTMEKKDIAPRIAGWALLLEEYDYVIEHRPGARMKHVDALSRAPAVHLLRNNVVDQVKMNQQADEKLGAIMKVLETGDYGDYSLDHGVLYRQHGGGKLLVIPAAMQNLPLSTYHVDHLGPLVASKKQYRYIFTVVDAFTKFVWIYPVKSTTAEEILQKLEIQKATFRNPARIISDRGAAFTSKAFQKYCEAEGIEHLLTTTGVPRGNGQVEKINGIIVPALTKLSIDDVDKQKLAVVPASSGPDDGQSGRMSDLN
ncbi:uncharacterized protein LOC129765966 [Toxorhynchites rutilus septentrionalis]|uniref:uncharacterized protein LOC129765966 n=1 Tax=Toxorhynchites rutilus septentrionalis TaxID=329112 RepID=UPI0024794B9D|nr:uncharacterized protein LOC129765966 [Toxorhynchites rutilus septentrionalis]